MISMQQRYGGEHLTVAYQLWMEEYGRAIYFAWPKVAAVVCDCPPIVSHEICCCRASSFSSMVVPLSSSES
jgi:hypothetical protein